MKEAPVCIKFVRCCERDARIISEIWKSHSSGRTFIPHGALFPPCNIFFYSVCTVQETLSSHLHLQKYKRAFRRHCLKMSLL